MSGLRPPGYDNLPPPPGYDDVPEKKSWIKPAAILGGVALLVAAGAAAFMVKSRSSSPGGPTAPADAAVAPVIAAKIVSPIPDYGSADATTPGLPGDFYDLLKTPAGGNSELPRGAAAGPAFVALFLKGDMTAEMMKSGLWSAPTTLRAARFTFGVHSSKEVQEFFGVNSHRKTASPVWAVVYRGRVKAPFTGEFRFVGFGSDDLAVRFDGAPVFEAWHARVKPGSDGAFEEVFRFGKPKKNGSYVGDPVRAGLWIPVEQGKVYDIEIAMSHALPYSVMKFALMYERKGEEPAADAQGYKTYARFRVADDPGPPVPEDPEVIPPATDGPVFPVVP